MMKSIRPIIATIFLAIFSLIQFVDLHVFDHEANDVDCQLCQMTSEDTKDDGYLNVDSIEIPSIITIPSNVVRNSYEQHYFDSPTQYLFFNKAPPTA
ncbi:hypothetical protein J8281_03130 [Aquimarina sp. U1-2]|uniref:hypothetical protein n=1 Tax=Aquimarina sp. U1-2 TaxID=2823141 RepID=UPI001AECFBF2|nr:hypothetical protein [Aquimarina sp. U1-2]MBP2831170.1 hypothetical protein [Aquimarina sp. U1-2]